MNSPSLKTGRVPVAAENPVEAALRRFGEAVGPKSPDIARQFRALMDAMETELAHSRATVAACGEEITRVNRLNEQLGAALASAVKIASEAAEEWDKAPEGMRAGKILLALAGHRRGYRPDTDRIHRVLAGRALAQAFAAGKPASPIEPADAHAEGDAGLQPGPGSLPAGPGPLSKVTP